MKEHEMINSLARNCASTLDKIIIKYILSSDPIKLESSSNAAEHKDMCPKEKWERLNNPTCLKDYGLSLSEDELMQFPEGRDLLKTLE